MRTSAHSVGECNKNYPLTEYAWMIWRVRDFFGVAGDIPDLVGVCPARSWRGIATDT